MAQSFGTTDEIKARLNIVELIGSYVRLEKAGQHWKARCPFHQERSPSFMVNEEKGMWHCFGCGKGGDAFAFVMEIEGLEFREALTMLADKTGVELPRFREEAHSKESKDRTFQLLELATKFYEKQLWEGAGKDKILQYLLGRGLSEASIRRFRLGFAPEGWRHLSEFLEGRGFRSDELERAGLTIKKDGGRGSYDRFRDRIMFPVFDILGRTIGYSARMAPGGDESQAKYINTPETPVYHKSRALYGLFQGKQAMKQAGMTIVVEGNMDVIALAQAGLENVVAVSGTALTDEQLSLMKRYGNEVRLFFDMDGAGQKAARKSAELALAKELLVSVVALPFGKDAADMGQEDPERLRTAVEASVPAPRYFLAASLQSNSLDTPQGKRKIVEEFMELLLSMKNPIERSFWIKELSREIGMEEKIVVGVVNTAFLEKSRREGPSGTPFPSQRGASPAYSKRSERLREEIVALLSADAGLRETWLPDRIAGETRAFLEKHPLFFFVLQAGERDPLSLIEDSGLKNEAAKLIFRILDSPEFAGLEGKDREEAMSATLGRYLADLEKEVMTREKLLFLERAISEAREHGDREEEKRLLAQFVNVSSGKLPTPEEN